ncbi:pheromone processing endoprotease, variant 2 [Entomophthora muscae]|nr:pheromone processing endoprotease, variant 2 [Entomophthora muscae]
MQAVASELRIKYIGRVAKLDYCLFRKPKAHGREAGRVLSEAQKRDFLNRHGIKDFRADVPHQIDYYSTPNPDNAGFKKQWYLHNSVPGDGDLRVKYLWEKGITGANITVAVVDDGVNYLHKDLEAKFSNESSYNLATHGIWPYPSDNTNTHGTNCAGIVAAKKDGICGNGVAFDARLAGIKLPMKGLTSSQEAFALNFRCGINDIFSCSWGPKLRIDQLFSLPAILHSALATCTEKGRMGKGSIYVFASGNKGRATDNCAFSGYLNSIYTITVGAVNRFNEHIDYSEGCSNLLVTAYASPYGQNDIQTTAFRNSDCEPRFSGTSASAPMISGMVALMLSSRPDLTWRDVQHMLLLSARRVDVKHPSWKPTYAGRHFSNLYGYGVVDGEKISKLLQDYTLMPGQIKYQSAPSVKNSQLQITRSNAEDGFMDTIEVTPAMLNNKRMILEHVVVTLNLKYPSRSLLTIKLISPNNIVTDLITARDQDYSPDGFSDFPVMTLAHW